MNKVKKYITLGLLFAIPVFVYLFFASGIYHFDTLPVLTKDISDVELFSTLDRQNISLKNKITVLGFVGNDISVRETGLLNLNEKIYKRFYQFEDLQFVMLVPKGYEQQVVTFKEKLEDSTATDMSKWYFVFAEPQQIQSFFNQMKTEVLLDDLEGLDSVFILDKDISLRGQLNPKTSAYNIISVAEITNKMIDDVKVILAEYRLATKTNKHRK